MRKFAIILCIGSLMLAGTAYAQLTVPQGGIGTTTVPAGWVLVGNSALRLTAVPTTTVSCSGNASCTSFTVFGSTPVTISASGGAGTGVGTIATSALETAGQVAIFSSSSGYPAKQYSIATSTPALGSEFTYSGTVGSWIGGSSGTLHIANGGVSNTMLANSSVTINSTSCTLGSGCTVTAASSTLLANNNTFTGKNLFSNASSTLFTCTTCWIGTLGTALNGGGFQVNNIATPTSGSDAANKTYVDNAVAGVNPAVAVQAATIAAGDTSALTYNNGVSGVGATFTGSNNTALTIDGYTFTAIGQRLLVKNDTQSANPGAYNGIYYVTQIQSAILPPILTRALDYNMPSDINNTGAIPVVNGTVNGSTSWLLTSQVTTVGTSVLTYTQFSLNPSNIFTTAGTGLSGTGSNTVSLNLGANNVWAASTTMQQQLNLLSASSTLFSTGTFWNTGLTSAIALFDANHKETAYTGSSGVCTNQFPTSLSVLGVLGGCTSVADSFFTGQLGLSHGGTNASLSGASQIVAMNAGNTALTTNSGYTLTSSLFTAPNASTTNLTVTSLQIPNSSNPSPTVAGYLAQSTNSPYQLHIGNGNSATAVFDPQWCFTIQSPATSTWSGTSTQPAFAIPKGLTITSQETTVQPGGASLEVAWQYANPSAYSTVGPTYWPASSTPGVYTLSSNNTPAAQATSTISYGNPSSSPTSAATTFCGNVNGL